MAQHSTPSPSFLLVSCASYSIYRNTMISFYSDTSLGSMRNDDDLRRSNFDSDDAENTSPNSLIAQLYPAAVHYFRTKPGHLPTATVLKWCWPDAAAEPVRIHGPPDATTGPPPQQQYSAHQTPLAQPGGRSSTRMVVHRRILLRGCRRSHRSNFSPSRLLCKASCYNQQLQQLRQVPPP